MFNNVERFEKEVAILSELTEFENEYLSIRALENRVYTDSVLRSLPEINPSHDQSQEWKLRVKSCNRFLAYLKNNFDEARILDLGAGNGWFSNKMAAMNTQFNITAIDMNLQELQQGARVFRKDNLKFYYANIFDDVFPESGFDLIVINSVVQYFESLPQLLNRLNQLLTPNGSIHILDSPFYRKEAIHNAAKRSKDYFIKMGVPDMAKNYYHHSWDDLSPFNFSIKYNPKSLKNRVKKLTGSKDIPFPWIEIR